MKFPIKMKNEITTFNIRKEDLKTESRISDKHVKNNTDVRKQLIDRDIKPEQLPMAEDAKKVQRRLEKDEKQQLGKNRRTRWTLLSITTSLFATKIRILFA